MPLSKTRRQPPRHILPTGARARPYAPTPPARAPRPPRPPRRRAACPCRAACSPVPRGVLTRAACASQELVPHKMSDGRDGAVEALYTALARFIKDVDAPDLTDAWSAEHLARHAGFSSDVKECAAACFPGRPFGQFDTPRLVVFCAQRFPGGGAAPAVRDGPDVIDPTAPLLAPGSPQRGLRSVNVTVETEGARASDGADPSPEAAPQTPPAREPGPEPGIRTATLALLESEPSSANAAMVIDAVSNLDGGKLLGTAGRLRQLCQRFAAAKDSTTCFDQNVLELVGSAVSRDGFIIWLAHAAACRRVSGIYYDDAHTVLTTVFNLLGRTHASFMRLTIGRGGDCTDIAELPMTIITRPGKCIAPWPRSTGLEPWRRNGPVDVPTPYGREDCVLVAMNGAFGDVYLTRGWLSVYDKRLRQGPIDLQAVCHVVNRCKTPFVLNCIRALANYDVFLRTTGIYVAVVQLTLADGDVYLHAIYIDGNRGVVGFGYNDGGTDQITFMIENADRRDAAAAKASLLSPQNFPVDENEPGRALVSMEVICVAEVLLKTKALRHAMHAAYRFPTAAELKRAAETVAGGGAAPTATAAGQPGVPGTELAPHSGDQHGHELTLAVPAVSPGAGGSVSEPKRAAETVAGGDGKRGRRPG